MNGKKSISYSARVWPLRAGLFTAILSQAVYGMAVLVWLLHSLVHIHVHEHTRRSSPIDGRSCHHCPVDAHSENKPNDITSTHLIRLVASGNEPAEKAHHSCPLCLLLNVTELPDNHGKLLEFSLIALQDFLVFDQTDFKSVCILLFQASRAPPVSLPI
jgi:hypothetical protein